MAVSPVILTADAAAALVPSHSRVIVASLSAEPRTLTAALWRRHAELRDVTIISGMLLNGYPFLDGKDSPFQLRTWFMPGTLLGLDANDIQAQFLPASWSQTIRYLASSASDVALIQVSPADGNGYHSLGISASQGKALLEGTKLIIAEVNEAMPYTCGDSLIHQSRIGALVHASYPLPEFPHRPGDAIDARIGQRIAELVPDGATLQFGIGAIPGAAVRALANRNARDLSLISQLTDPAMELMVAGGCRTDRPAATIGEILGTHALYKWVHRNPAIDMADATRTHGIRSLCNIDRLVSVNSALEVDLYGQVNSEYVDGRHVGGIGGSIDFAMGAQAEGALSIIALRATTKRGVARIVPQLTTPAVTIPRTLTQIIVTENGVADLRGKTVRERAHVLAHLADESSREALLHHAGKL